MTDKKPIPLDFPELHTQPKFNWNASIALYLRRQKLEQEDEPKNILDYA